MNKLKIITFLIFIFLSACNNDKVETNMSNKLIEFEFITQDEEVFGLQDLEGEWSIVNFMYTDCTIICPTTTPNMATVQEKAAELDLDVQFVSFSVDPATDSPKILREYIKDYPIDLNNWSFLTGYDFKEIKKISNESFETVLEGGGPDEHAFVHSTSFFLVTPNGEIVKKYDGMSTDELNIIIDDLQLALSSSNNFKNNST